MIPVKDIIPPKSAPHAAWWILAVTAIGIILEWIVDVPGIHQPWLAVLNALFLWIFADNVEDRMGHGAFVALYVLCGVAGAIAHALFYPATALPMVGTSGATAGVLGAYLVLYPQSRVLVFVPIPIALVEVPALFFLTLYLVLTIPFGFAALAQAAAGLVAGALLCLRFRRPVVW